MIYRIYRTLFVVIAVALTASAAFGQTGQRPLRIITSFYPVYITTLNVAGGIPGVEIENLTPEAAGCLHDYALTTDQMKKLARADVLVVNGAGMESFTEKIAAHYPKLNVISLSDGLDLIRDGQGAVNPHVWVSVSGAIAQTRRLAAVLEAFDPSRKDLYNKNASDYARALEALGDRMRNELAPYRGRRIVTFHEAFAYFAREFGFEIAAVVERQPGSQPGAAELARTADVIRKTGVRAIFAEPQYPDSAAGVLARETGVSVYALDPAVTGPQDAGAYRRIMEKNLEVLKEALG